MSRCASCRVDASKLHKSITGSRTQWICTACNSRRTNARQLGRSSSLTRLGLLFQLAWLLGNLASAAGRKVLLSQKGRLEGKKGKR